MTTVTLVYLLHQNLAVWHCVELTLRVLGVVSCDLKKSFFFFF